MSDINPTKNLKLDTWYKTLIPIGGAIMIISLVYSPEGFNKKEIFFFGLGWFLLGIGEWKNERFHTQFVDQTAFNPFMKVIQKFRKNDKIGVPMELIGIIFIIISVLNMLDIITIFH